MADRTAWTKRVRFLTVLAASLACGFIAGTVAAQTTMIQPVSVTVSAGGYSGNYWDGSPAFTIDGSGLSDAGTVNTGDTVPGTMPLHAGASAPSPGVGNFVLTHNTLGDGDTGDLVWVLDLGAKYDLTKLVFWNWTRGDNSYPIMGLTLSTSTNGLPGSFLNANVLAMAGANSSSPEEFDINGSGVQYVQLSNWKAGSPGAWMGTMEIRFEGTASVGVNNPPHANAGPDQTLVGTREVTLDGSGSSDFDNDPLTYSWSDSLGDVIPAITNPTATLVMGVHAITLTVDDGRGGTNSDTVVISVMPASYGVITPVAATSSWVPNSWDGAASNLINGSGLSAPVTTNLASLVGVTHMWGAVETSQLMVDDNIKTITFDLGRVYDIYKIDIWNYGAINEGESRWVNGINVRSGPSEGIYGGVASITGIPDGVPAVASPLTTLTYATSGVRYIEFTLERTMGGWRGLGEVRFEGTPGPMEVKCGTNDVVILHGDATPSVEDGTDFGGVVLEKSLTHMFKISNFGDAVLNLTGDPRVSASGNADFSVTAQPADHIDSNGSTTFEITFSPAGAAGQIKTATVSIYNSSPVSPYTFSIKGTAAGGTVVIIR